MAEEAAPGFARKRVHVLTWPADSEFAGQVVKVRTGSLNDYFHQLELWERPTPDDATHWHHRLALYENLEHFLVSWNLVETGEDGAPGTPVPPTVAGMRTVDVDQMLAIIAAWQAVHGGGPGPKGEAETEQPNSGLNPDMESTLPIEPLPDDPPT